MSDDQKISDGKPEEGQIIAERRAKLAALREQAKAAGKPAFPNDYRRDVLATHLCGRVRRQAGRVVRRESAGAPARRGPHDVPAHHGQGEFRQAPGPHRPDPDLPAARCARRIVRGIQEVRRRRHPRRHRNAVQDEDRRAVGARRRAAHVDQVVAAAARQVAWHGRRRHALSPALRRSHRQRAEPERVLHAHADPQVPARLSRVHGFPRSRDADAADRSRVAPPRGRFARITTRSTWTCSCASRRSSFSSASRSAASSACTR